MSTQEHAQSLARELAQAMKAMKAAEAKAKHVSEELRQVLAQVRAEADAALLVVEYPVGRYDCASCGHSMLFTEPTRELPACDNCGNRNFAGHEPQVTKIEPPPPKKYPAAMYQCVGCGARIAVVADTDELTPCEICGIADLTPLEE